MSVGLQPSIKEAINSLIMLVIWEIWTERNNIIFRQVHRSVNQILTDIQDAAKTWAYAGNKGLRRLLHADEANQMVLDTVVVANNIM